MSAVVVKPFIFDASCLAKMQAEMQCHPWSTVEGRMLGMDLAINAFQDPRFLPSIAADPVSS